GAVCAALLTPAVLPHPARADLVGARDVRDVVALDAVRQPGETERALEIFLNELHAVAAREEVILQRDGRVRLRHRDELAPRPALGHEHVHAAAGEPAQELADQLGLRALLRDENLWRQRHVVASALADERRPEPAVRSTLHLS